MPVVVDQNRTTGTKAIPDRVGVGSRVGLEVGVRVEVGSGVRIAVTNAALVGFGSGAGDGSAGAQDITTVAIATAPSHRRAIQDLRMSQA
jgi:hypothetical protein